MSALVAYGSSDEDDTSQNAEDVTNSRNVTSTTRETFQNTSPKSRDLQEGRRGRSNTTKQKQTINGYSFPRRDPDVTVSIPHSDAPVLGPVLGPQQTEDSATPLDESDELQPAIHLSPYSSNRALLRQYTLPTLPNYDIPESPPGSPPQNTNAKFNHFLELKTQGVHFNEKLSKSSALKNPSLMQKLMDFSDIDDNDQYASTLPTDLWNPSGFPEWSFKENLASRQQKMLKTIEEEKSRNPREPIEFVPASASVDSGRNGNSSSSSRIGQKSAAERVMAGLDRRSNSPQVQSSLKRKSRFDT